MDMQLVDEVNEYLSVKGVRDWSLGLAHLKALCTYYMPFFICLACYVFSNLFIYAGIAAGMGTEFRRICLPVCLSDCLYSNRKMT